MSTEEVDIHERAPSPDVPEPSDAPIQSPPPPERKRPKLDLGLGERKRGKSMFGILLGTLNKARSEDKERSASEAAKRRALLEQRLASKLRTESDSVRKQESSKKQKSQATRMEEDLCVKDSIYKLRYKRLPILAGFLSTSDKIPEDESEENEAEEEIGDSELEKELSNLPRSHPPPLYYLPAVLLPRQERWIKRRKERVSKATAREHTLFLSERTEGIEKIQHTRKEAEAEAEAAAASLNTGEEKMDTDEKEKKDGTGGEDVEMDMEGGAKGDDVVEY